jgi:hypothetical protein
MWKTIQDERLESQRLKEVEERAGRRANFVRLSRLLLEVAYQLLRAHFRQAYADARVPRSEWDPSKATYFWDHALDQGTKTRLRGDAPSKVQAGDVEAWDCTILLEVLINGVIKHRSQLWQVHCFEKRMGGGTAWDITLPIRHCRNSLFAHVAAMQLSEQALQQEAGKLLPTLVKLHAKLDAQYRPFDDVKARLDAILKGKLRTYCAPTCARRSPCAPVHAPPQMAGCPPALHS